MVSTMPPARPARARKDPPSGRNGSGRTADGSGRRTAQLALAEGGRGRVADPEGSEEGRDAAVPLDPRQAPLALRTRPPVSLGRRRVVAARFGPRRRAAADDRGRLRGEDPVSYTHLTL